MNQTQAPGDAPHGERPRGPRVTRDQMLDVDRLRRSSSDKHVAGVAGGLGRHFDIDPLIFRVAFAVTAFFGVGVMLYGALWLLLPDDAEHAPISTTPETRKVLVLTAAGVAALLLLSMVVGSHSIFWLAALALAGLGLYAILKRPPTGPYQSPQAGPDASAPTGHEQDDAEHTTATGTDAARPRGPERPAASYQPQPQPRPRRTGMILFWPTVALLAIAMGSLAMYDIDHVVADGAYPALAIAVIGLMLVIGAFAGRAGGLILLGLLTIPPLVLTSTLGNDFTRGGSNQDLAPASAAMVQPHYDIGNGRLELDLTRLAPDELAKLSDHEIEIDMKAGEIVVILPADVGYHVEAALSLAGEIDIDGRTVNGMNPSLSQSATPRTGALPDAALPSIRFDIDGTAGRIAVETTTVSQGATS